MEYKKKSKGISVLALSSLSKNLFFDRLAEVKGAAETNKSNLSAYVGTVRFDLCSKSKHLAEQALFSGKENGLPQPFQGFAMTWYLQCSSVFTVCFDDRWLF